MYIKTYYVHHVYVDAHCSSLSTPIVSLAYFWRFFFFFVVRVFITVDTYKTRTHVGTYRGIRVRLY